MYFIEAANQAISNHVAIDILEQPTKKPLPEHRGKTWEKLKDNSQIVAILASVILGLIIGILVRDAVQRSTDPSTKEIVMYIKFPGEIFIRLLRMIILPLTMSSIIVSLADITVKSSGRLGKWTFIYFFTTTVFACLLGLLLAKIIKPGEASDKGQSDSEPSPISTLDSFLDLIRNMFPENLVESAIKTTQTYYDKKLVDFKYKKQNMSVYNTSADTMATFLEENTVVPWHTGMDEVLIISNKVIYTFGGTVRKNGSNVLGLIVFSIMLGIIIQKLKKDGRPLLEFFDSLLKAVMLLVRAIMWVSPLGILSLIAGSIAEVEDILGTFRDVGFFTATVITGVFIQSFLIYPIIYLAIVRKNPFRFLAGLIPALVTAFGTSSSSSTLPVIIRCVSDNNKVDRRVSMFVLPIGTTCNKDGSAINHVVTVIFIANLESINLTFGELVLTVMISMFVSAASAGIPSAGLSNSILVLEAVGLPTRFLGLIFAVEWIVDRFKTLNNVLGTAYGAGLMYHTTNDPNDQNPTRYETDHVEDENTKPSNEGGEVVVDTSF